MDFFHEALQLLSKVAIAGGGLWAAWGAITLGFALKNSQGSDQRESILQIVGGAMVIAAASLVTYITF